MHLTPVFHLRPVVAIYDLLTAQDLWRGQIAHLLRHADRAAGAAAATPLRVLDLGCGPGESAFVVARELGAEVVGVDISARMVEAARRRLRRRHPELTGVRFEVADATALPFADSGFDLAVGHSFLYLVNDRPAALAEALRVLRPGGQLLLMEPNAEGALWRAARGALPGLGAALRRPLTSLRFALSMLLWRLFGRSSGCLSPALAERLFRAAGFAEIRTEPSLGGLGLHCIGRRGVAEAAGAATPRSRPESP